MGETDATLQPRFLLFREPSVWGGVQNFLGWSKGRPFFFSGPKGGDQNFLRVKEGEAKNFSQKIFCAFGAIPSWIHLSKKFHAFDATFLFSIFHALYHVHIKSYFVSTPGHSHCNLFTIHGGGSFNEGHGGDQNFFQKPKGGPDFFAIGQEGDQNFFAYAKGGGPEKGHRKEMAPPPAKK